MAYQDLSKWCRSIVRLSAPKYHKLVVKPRLGATDVGAGKGLKTYKLLKEWIIS